MVKIQTKFGNSPFQIDGFPDEIKDAGAKTARTFKRSVNGRGSLHCRPGGVAFITDDEWQWIKEARKDHTRLFIVLADDTPLKKKTTSTEAEVKSKHKTPPRQPVASKSVKVENKTGK